MISRFIVFLLHPLEMLRCHHPSRADDVCREPGEWNSKLLWATLRLAHLLSRHPIREGEAVPALHSASSQRMEPAAAEWERHDDRRRYAAMTPRIALAPHLVPIDTRATL
jgi:hypothetical protein